MDITEKLARSKSSEKIDFTKIGRANLTDPLAKIQDSDKLKVEPVWTKPGDYEGRLYAHYISEHPEYDGVYVRTEALSRLKQAAASLPAGYQLIVRAGHRPIGVQKVLLQGVMGDYLKNHPDADNDAALAHARMYVSDPSIKLPPHCCGAAVDVELLDTKTGKYVDFGGELNEDSAISHLHSPDITPAQRENRLLLLKTMLAAGFSSYYAEWWHYSYGDEIWAWFYGHNACLYSVIDL